MKSFLEHAKIITILAIILLSIDLIWINWIAFPIYAGTVRNIQGSVMEPNVIAAILAYIIFVVGLVYLVVDRVETWQEAVLYGALFGFVVYGIFDFTNLTMFKKWTWRVTIVDIIWGIVLCGSVAGIVKALL